MKRMKVLVFDDSEIHRESARLTLGNDHNVTIVGTYDEAQEALKPKLDYDKARRLTQEMCKEAGIPEGFKSWEKGADPKHVAKEKELSEKAYELSTTYPDFDAVLTDLMVPASKQAQGDQGRKFVGQEMPLGTMIALLAIAAGIRKVAVVTDMSHHNHCTFSKRW